VHKKAILMKQEDYNVSVLYISTKILAFLNILFLIYCGYLVYRYNVVPWISSNEFSDNTCRVCNAPATNSIGYSVYRSGSRSNISISVCDIHYEKYKNAAKPPMDFRDETLLHFFIILCLLGITCFSLFNRKDENINNIKGMFYLTGFLSILLFFIIYYVEYISKFD
jgi:hypothetical protein